VLVVRERGAHRIRIAIFGGEDAEGSARPGRVLFNARRLFPSLLGPERIWRSRALASIWDSLTRWGMLLRTRVWIGGVRVMGMGWSNVLSEGEIGIFLSV